MSILKDNIEYILSSQLEFFFCRVLTTIKESSDMGYNFIYTSNYKMNQHHYILAISILLTTGLLWSMVVFSSVNAVERTSRKIDTEPLSELAPKPANSTKIIDSKALDILMKPTSYQIQKKISTILEVNPTTTNTFNSQSNFKTATHYEFVKKWGSKRIGDGQFTVPYSVEVDSEGNVWIDDRGNHSIQKFDKDDNFLLKFGSTGTGYNQFSEVEHMTTEKYDNVYVNDPQWSDTGSGKPSVKKFDTSGNFITKFDSLGVGDGQFTDPEHLTIDSDGNVYVSNRASNTITVFKPVV
jgi:hypothetical protein